MNLKIEENIRELTSKIESKLQTLNNLEKNNEEKNNEKLSILKDEIWELSKKKFVLKTQSDPFFKKYEGLIFTVGFSHEPLILNILANSPRGVFFIYTKESEQTIDKVFDDKSFFYISLP